MNLVHKNHPAVNHHLIPLMMAAEKVSEMLGSSPELTRFVAREDFTKN
jgi:hypothetical protein